MTHSLRALARSWREEAETLRHRYADDRIAAVCETHATELETALHTALDKKLTLREAADVSGYSYSHLRRLMDAGDVPNVGKRGAPRVRVGDLPYRPRQVTAGRAISAADSRPPRRGVRRISPT